MYNHRESMEQTIQKMNSRRQVIIDMAEEAIRETKEAKTYDPIMDKHWIDKFNEIIANEKERML